MGKYNSLCWLTLTQFPAQCPVVHAMIGGKHMAVTDEGPSAALLEPDHPGILVGGSVGATADPIRDIFLAAVTFLGSGLNLSQQYYINYSIFMATTKYHI